MARPLNLRHLLDRGDALQRRVMLAEILGTPRSREPWRSPLAPELPEPPAASPKDEER